MALANNDSTKLMVIIDSKSLMDVLTDDEDATYVQGMSENVPKYRQSSIETPVLLEHAATYNSKV